jgi:hypothetical protein
VHIFHSRTGKDLGDYTGPNFVQRNILVRDRSIPFTVLFRPDVTSDRLEVVFEWGDPFRSPPSNLEAYSVEITQDGKAIVKIDVPRHIWLSRWRWQSAPRPFVKTPDDLFAEKVFPRFKRTSPRQSLPQQAPDYSIMGFSNVTVYMPTTGERGDLGILPEYYAAYLATGDEGMKKSMLAWAEAAGSFFWHLRDSKTWAPLNWYSYPKSNTYYDQRYSSPSLSLYTQSRPRGRDNAIEVDASHEPALAFLPFMLTGDLYYLEELQFMATYFLHSTPMAPLLFYVEQTRGFAWSLRTMIDVLHATPEKVTGSLLPKSYWRKIIDLNLSQVMAKFVHGKTTKTSVFASGVDGGRIPFWQEDYLASVLGVVVYRGYEAWRPVFEWKIRSDVARTDGKSGWPRTVPTFYYCKPGKTTVMPGGNKGDGTLNVDNLDFTVLGGTWTVIFQDQLTFTVLEPGGKLNGHGKVGSGYDDAHNAMRFTVSAGAKPFAAGDSFRIAIDLAKTWGELADANDVTELPDGNISRKLGDYAQTVRAALVMGVLNGVEAAKPCLAWYDPQMMSVYSPDWRWSITT